MLFLFVHKASVYNIYSFIVCILCCWGFTPQISFICCLLLSSLPVTHVPSNPHFYCLMCNISPASTTAAIIYFHHLSNFYWTKLKWVSDPYCANHTMPRDMHIFMLQAWHTVKLHNGSTTFSQIVPLKGNWQLQYLSEMRATHSCCCQRGAYYIFCCGKRNQPQSMQRGQTASLMCITQLFSSSSPTVIVFFFALQL